MATEIKYPVKVGVFYSLLIDSSEPPYRIHITELSDSYSVSQISAARAEVVAALNG